MASKYWTGTGTNWSGATTWYTAATGGSQTTPPVAGDDVFLQPSATATLTLDVDTPALNSLTIASTATLTATTSHTLTTTNGVTDSGNLNVSGGATLTIDSAITGTGKLTAGATATAGTLLLNGASSIGSAVFAGTTGTTGSKIEIGSTGSLTVTGGAVTAVGAYNLQLDGPNSAFSNATGITVSTGVISGQGKVTGAITASGAAQITENGGKLEIVDKISGGTTTLTVGVGATDLLLLDAASDSVTSVVFASATGAGTLEIGASGSLSVTNAATALALGANSITLDNASGVVQLTVTKGVTIAGGSIADATGATGGVALATTIKGYGTVGVALDNGTGAGAITASGGVLDLKGSVNQLASGTDRALAVDTLTGSDLKIDGTATAASFTMNNANQTLEIGAAGALTITSAGWSVTGGEILLDGGAFALSAANTLTLGANASLQGAGTLTANVAVAGAGTIEANSATGGTLTLNGALSGTTSLVIGAPTGASTTLNLAGATNAALSATYGSTGGALDVSKSSGSLTLTDKLTLTAGDTLGLTGVGSIFTDSAGVTMTGGALSGVGALAANTNVSGFGTIGVNLSSSGTLTAVGDGAGGVILDLAGTVSNRTLAIGSANASDLEIDGTATAAAISNFSSANQTLEIGAAGALTLTSAQAYTNGAILLDGGSLDDAGGLTVGAGATLAGAGAVGATTAINGAGAINANVSGATLELKGALTGTTSLTIGAASGAAATLKLDGADTIGSASFTGAGGTLEIGAAGSLTMSGGVTLLSSNDVLKLDGTGNQILSGSVSVYGTVTGTGSLGPNVSIDGAGTVDVAVNGSSINTTGGMVFTKAVTNASSVVVQSGSIEFDSAATVNSWSFSNQQGSIVLGAGGSLDVTSGQLVLSLINVTGSGVLLNSNVVGVGTISAELEGGKLTAGGISSIAAPTDIIGTVDATAATAFDISPAGSLSENASLWFSGVVGTASINPIITFDAPSGGHWGGLNLTGEGSGATFASNFHGVIAGFTGTANKQASSDQIYVSGTGADHVLWSQTQTGASPSGTLTVENASNVVLATLTLDGTYNQSQFAISAGDMITYAACYVAGTRIATPGGEVAIEDLQIGDLVLNADGAARPIRWLGRRAIALARHPDPDRVRPIRIAAHAFGEALPKRDLLVSPGHNLALEGALIPASALVNGISVRTIDVAEIEYWHVELDSHDILLAEGLPAESYLDTGNRAAFQNGAAFVEAHPDFRPRRFADTCLPLVQQGPEVVRAKARLLSRLAGQEIVDDADAHVKVDGRRVEPIRLSPARLAFVLPEGGREIALCSRRFTPAHLLPESCDTRELGLCVGRLEVDGVRLETLPHEADWHEAEAVDSRFSHRWTRGAARLPGGARIVVVEQAGFGRYWREAETARDRNQA